MRLGGIGHEKSADQNVQHLVDQVIQCYRKFDCLKIFLSSRMKFGSEPEKTILI